MSGRIEKEDKLIAKINDKLQGLPSIFTDFYRYLESEGKSYGTIKHYIEYVSEFAIYSTHGQMGEDFYAHISVANVRDYITSLRRRDNNGKEVRTGDSIQCAKYSGINTFFKFLSIDDYIDVNPMAKTKRPKMREQHDLVYLTDDEIGVIMTKIETEAPRKMVNRDKALVSLGLSTALRVAALTSVDISDINFEQMTIHVIEKENKERYIPFGNNMKNILAAWILDRNLYFRDADTDALFLSQWNRRLTEEGVRLLIKKYAGALNKKVSPHILRKSAAMRMLENDVDVVTVSKFLGHESLEVTQHYVDALQRNKEKAVKVLDNML